MYVFGGDSKLTFERINLADFSSFTAHDTGSSVNLI